MRRVTERLAMSHLDAIKLSEALCNRLVDFSVDDNFTRDAALRNVCRNIWGGRPEDGGLVSELWVEGAFPSKNSDETLDSLVRSGEFNEALCEQLHRRDAVPRDRPLYTHQLEAIRTAREACLDAAHPALVITAGTGAGKTESFLLPVLNDLFSQRNAPDSEPASGEGVKCLILYPMNALVNDQIERLYAWLKGQRSEHPVTLFHFTSETPEDAAAKKLTLPLKEDACRMKLALPLKEDACRIWTRKDAREKTPDILVTNYSMLEYMLCRPQDAPFFGDALRAIVLDEAHLYTGTLAAEMTLLLRRVLLRCGLESKDVLHIATSATIGTGANDELKNFAATLFSKNASSVKVINGERARIEFGEAKPPYEAITVKRINECAWQCAPTIQLNNVGDAELASDEEECRRLASSLPALVAEEGVPALTDCENQPAQLLHRALRHSPIIQRLEDILWESKGVPLKLGDLSRRLWNCADEDARRATTTLLQLGASARRKISELPLAPHRIHLLARPSDGFVVCRNPKCTGDEALKFTDRLGCVIAGYADHCPHCTSETLTLVRCRTCGEVALAGALEQGDYRPATTSEIRGYEEREHEESELHFQSFSDGAKGKILSSGFSQVNDQCPNCGEKNGWKPLASGAPLTLSIVAETALAELPEYPSQKNLWLPARGRRMLAFSDSRTEAARLGVRLRLQHERQVFRSILAKAIVSQPRTDEKVLADIQSEIQEFEKKLKSEDLSDFQRIRIERNLADLKDEMAQGQDGGSIAKWKDLLAKLNSLAELFDFDFGKKHSVGEWNQSVWELNKTEVVKQLSLLLGREMASPSRGFTTLETIGLVEVGYPNIEKIPTPNNLLGLISTRSARESIEKHWATLLAVLCDDLRAGGIITLGDKKADDEYQFGRQLIGRWTSKHDAWRKLERFVGATETQRRRQFATAFLKRCGLDENVAKETSASLLEHVFDALKQAAENKTVTWLEFDRPEAQSKPVDGIRPLFPELTLRRPERWFRCETTNYVFTRCVLGIAPGADLSKELKSVTEAELGEDSRYGRQRNEYLDSKVFSLGLWAEEHSAQLAPEENRRLQDLFKAGVRNILSSTTTLELGIDIGGLTAVLMGNVPPGKANYLQRAGRAGRRADGSSLVLTFARPRPFDREVFTRFDEYLKKPFRSPRAFLERERIARRHLHAFLLGEFFRVVYPPGVHVGAMNAFGDMGAFCGLDISQKWESGSHAPSRGKFIPDYETVREAWWESPSKPLTEQFLNFIGRRTDDGTHRAAFQTIARATGIENVIADGKRLRDEIVQDFKKKIDEWKTDYEHLLKAWDAAIADKTEKWTTANAIHYQLKQLYNTTVIESLGDCQFLPRYGFPIGLMNLKVIETDPNNPKRIREGDQFRLQRSGLLALGEYVPGSQLLAGGRLITSRGLLKHWTGENLDNSPGLRGLYATCRNGHVFYKTSSEKLGACTICDEPVQSNRHCAFLIPKYGFSSAVWDPPKVSGDVEKIGRTERATVTFRRGDAAQQENFGGIAGLSARYKEDGEIFVYNAGDFNEGFIICTHCGYAESEPKRKNGKDEALPKSFQEHAPLRFSYKGKNSLCEGAKTPLRKQRLAARQTTDALLLDFSRFTKRWNEEADVILTTLGYALQNAGAKLLGLDTRELGVLTLAQFGVVLYDNVPGGAGHVFELMNVGREWLEAARERMFVKEEHHARCETACLDCLLTFDAQNAMDEGRLARRKAYDILSELLQGAPPPTSSLTESPEGAPSPSHRSKSKEERLARNRRGS
jgi:hypothetical protein